MEHPSFFQTNQWDKEKQHFLIKPNPEFMALEKEVFKPTDTIYVTCRSGGRSAWPVNQLAAAGFKNAYNITDGMERDTVDDPQSMYVGQRMKNGWKNSGVPWTFKADPKLMHLPQDK